ncbi:MAG: helix-turn-helix transcriptional regulator [Actinoplanes sp.]
MDNRAEVREFLTSRRARISPERAGLTTFGQRRVPGLRRSEVAGLAGMSVEYYAKLERGALTGASAGVLDALARALQLDDAERAHLLRLAHEADGSNAVARPRSRSSIASVRPSLQRSLDAITTAPAIVGNHRMDLVAANPLGRAMYWEHYADPATSPNFARFIFLDSGARRFYPDWESAADVCVANLRTSAGVDPHDQGLRDLVGLLSARSDGFRSRWGSHDVRTHGSGVKEFHHHVVGGLTLAFESMDLRADPGLAMTLYTAEPGSPSDDALRLLASWAASPELAPSRGHAEPGP